jgi:hypothetical protein
LWRSRRSRFAAAPHRPSSRPDDDFASREQFLAELLESKTDVAESLRVFSHVGFLLRGES